MQARLHVRKGPLRGTLFPLCDAVVTLVGRAASNHIVLTHREVSANHCVLAPSRKEEGFVLIDARSRGGTVVNGRPCTKDVIHFGDIIRVGPFELELLAAEEDRPAPAPRRPAAERPIRFQLTKHRRRGKGQPLLPASATVVGRGTLAHIRFDDPFVSEFQCMLALDPQDDSRMPFLVDLHSSNGTYVNGRPIHRKHVLPGDGMTIGHTEIVVRRVEIPQPQVEEVPLEAPPRPGRARIATTQVVPPAVRPEPGERAAFEAEPAPQAEEQLEAHELETALEGLSWEAADQQGEPAIPQGRAAEQLDSTSLLDEVPEPRPRAPATPLPRLLAPGPGDYEAFYGFRDPPFDAAADPDYLFHSQRHWDAVSTLARWLKTGPPLAVLFGERGCGKSLIVACLARRLTYRRPVPVVVRPEAEKATLDDLVAAAIAQAPELHGAPPAEGKGALELWHDAIAQLRRRNILVAFLVDDAHTLPDELLTSLAELLDPAPAREATRVLLAGDESLRDLVAGPPLSDHLGTSCYLAPLEPEEVAAYVAHRLFSASGKRELIFTRRALELVAAYSQGVPQLINMVADAALSCAFRANRRQVSRDIVEHAIRHVLEDEPPRETE